MFDELFNDRLSGGSSPCTFFVIECPSVPALLRMLPRHHLGSESQKKAVPLRPKFHERLHLKGLGMNLGQWFYTQLHVKVTWMLFENTDATTSEKLSSLVWGRAQRSFAKLCRWVDAIPPPIPGATGREVNGKPLSIGVVVRWLALLAI